MCSPTCTCRDLERVDETRIPAPVPMSGLLIHTRRNTFGVNRNFTCQMTGGPECYFADLADLDEQMGILLECLIRTGRADNTISSLPRIMGIYWLITDFTSRRSATATLASACL